jgi:hypothetical protein
MDKRLLIITACFIVTIGSKAQNSINTAGGMASGEKGSISYSVGQLNYTFYQGEKGSYAEGVQQPYEITDITSANHIHYQNIQVLLYPNPTNNYLNLFIDDSDFRNLNFVLYDISGKEIEIKDIAAKLTTIDMAALIKSTYFLKVYNKINQVRVFKIIKN